MEIIKQTQMKKIQNETLHMKHTFLNVIYLI